MNDLPPINLDLDLGPEPPQRPPDWNAIEGQVERLIEFYEYVDSAGNSNIGEWDTFSDGRVLDILQLARICDHTNRGDTLEEVLEGGEKFELLRGIINRFATKMGRYIELKIARTVRSGARFLQYKINNTEKIADGGAELGGALDL